MFQKVEEKVKLLDANGGAMCLFSVIVCLAVPFVARKFFNVEMGWALIFLGVAATAFFVVPGLEMSERAGRALARERDLGRPVSISDLEEKRPYWFLLKEGIVWVCNYDPDSARDRGGSTLPADLRVFDPSAQIQSKAGLARPTVFIRTGVLLKQASKGGTAGIDAFIHGGTVYTA